MITCFKSRLKGRKYGIFCNKDCLGLFRSEHLTGSLGANFQTGNQFDRKYIRVIAPWHPNKANDSTEALHRIVVEARLGRFLSREEIVHHIDGNPENNHWTNLKIMLQSEHAKDHINDGTITRDKLTGQFRKGEEQ